MTYNGIISEVKIRETDVVIRYGCNVIYALRTTAPAVGDRITVVTDKINTVLSVKINDGYAFVNNSSR